MRSLRVLVGVAVLGGCHPHHALRDLRIDLPPGWTRTDRDHDPEGILVTSPPDARGGIAQIEIFRSPHAEDTPEAFIAWKNHRDWNDEVAADVDLAQILDDGWIAGYVLHARVRSSPEHLVYSTRRVGGQAIDCEMDTYGEIGPRTAAFAICTSLRF